MAGLISARSRTSTTVSSTTCSTIVPSISSPPPTSPAVPCLSLTLSSLRYEKEKQKIGGWILSQCRELNNYIDLLEIRFLNHGPSNTNLLPGARVGGHGYSSRLVCLFVTGESSPGCHGAAFTAWIAFTQQVISNSGRFCFVVE